MSRSLRFARMVASRLRDGEVNDSPEANIYLVNGKLDTGVLYASITVRIPKLFRDLKRRPPVAVCHEPWMRQDRDWHNFSTWMCWVLPHEWRAAMNWKGKPVNAILSEGCDWLIQDVSILINRHYHGHDAGMTEWPKEWNAWGHGDAGVAEYLLEQGRRNARRS